LLILASRTSAAISPLQPRRGPLGCDQDGGPRADCELAAEADDLGDPKSMCESSGSRRVITRHERTSKHPRVRSSTRDMNTAKLPKPNEKPQVVQEQAEEVRRDICPARCKFERKSQRRLAQT
jgi:hypothetical protein